ncbi:uncharacterized protein EV154DRAFT_240121 [Mucor mucedo]|uniref:uncharacterized protein n=1 Tax=Mucor mucedo TaxID=29922 RepID=UPI00221ED79C|nr:uncharacterized protein EV154DRAFT_240121 [Mucor mucedo]KAI7896469.1 hypothetical protein EV154DRAFT_240121 [Mucor mucedo]
MYQQSVSSMDSTLRIFSPIILFHDASSCSSDHQVIQLKKQKVNAMLKSNGQFWSNVIWSTRNSAFSSPPQTPPPTTALFTSCNSSVSSCPEEGGQTRQKWYGTPSDEEELEEEEEEEEEEEDVDVEEDDTRNIQTVKKRVKSTNGRKRRGNLPKSVTAILKQWLIDHCRHPYPTEEEKRSLRIKTNLTLNQISNWFINARRRILPLILSSPNTIASPETTSEKKTRRKRGWMSDSTQPKQTSPKGRRQQLV